MYDVRFGKLPRLRASLAEQMRRTPAPQARSLCKSYIGVVSPPPPLRNHGFITFRPHLLCSSRSYVAHYLQIANELRVGIAFS